MIAPLSSVVFRLALIAAGAFAVAAPARGAETFAGEDRDFRVPPQAELKQPPYHGPTPMEAPGAKTILTADLKRLVEGGARPVLVDVLAGEHPLTVPGAVWMPEAGHGTAVGDAMQAPFAARLAKLTAGDPERPLVFFCLSAECWLSYNASLRALAAGHRQVYWYRGGIAAWRQAKLPLAPLPPATR
ncbi:MAG: rhodanese-like domain-containing protein [Burkholderiales bacterium]|nr:rhodanese-like domain-containing protein [Burkholderiales bacterium]